MIAEEERANRKYSCVFSDSTKKISGSAHSWYFRLHGNIKHKTTWKVFCLQRPLGCLSTSSHQPVSPVHCYLKWAISLWGPIIGSSNQRSWKTGENKTEIMTLFRLGYKFFCRNFKLSNYTVFSLLRSCLLILAALLWPLRKWMLVNVHQKHRKYTQGQECDRKWSEGGTKRVSLLCQLEEKRFSTRLLLIIKVQHEANAGRTHLSVTCDTGACSSLVEEKLSCEDCFLLPCKTIKKKSHSNGVFTQTIFFNPSFFKAFELICPI